MRYYDITLYDSDWNNPERIYSSVKPDGSFNIGALNIELDLPITGYHDVGGPATIRIFGVSLSDILDLNRFKFRNLEVRLGMSSGLPFANPDQSGVALRGQIWQAWGNWQGREQYLHLAIVNSSTISSDVRNLVWKCKKNTPASSSIADTLNSANYTDFSIKITDKFILSEDYTAIYHNLGQFASDLRRISLSRVKIKDYYGVTLACNSNVINVYDGTEIKDSYGSKSNPVKIDFIDLIGQPVWIEYAYVQIQSVMRADINIGDYIKLPEAQQSYTAQSYTSFKDKLALSGIYLVNSLRHIGAFRERHADSWVTTFTLIPV